MATHLSKLVWLLIFVFVSVTSINGQRTITGTITDANDNLPLIGANVLVTGTTVGTTTNLDGEYSLEVPADAVSLTFSYTGYETVVHLLTGANTVDIAMDEGTILDEIVVIGYGTVKRKDATGSIQSVNTESFNRGAITGPQDLLSGKVAGVTISSGGAPGDGAAIRIRGESSLSASNNPLIVIDGVPLDNSGVAGSRNPLNVINPNDIASFTVLKDASATAIYGNRASGGVIIITTKRGSVGSAMKVNYNAQFSVGKKANSYEVLNADEFREFVGQQWPTAVGLLGNSNTDWQEAIFQSAFGQDHNLSVSGAIGELPYRVSVGYTNKDGIVKTDNFTRYTGSLNLNPGFLDNTLQLKLGLKGMLSENRFVDSGGAIGASLRYDPTQSILDAESPYGGYTAWLQADGTPNPIATVNPVALIEQTDNTAQVKRLIASFQADYRFDFMPELRANLNLAYDKSDSEGDIFVPKDAAWEFFNGGRVQEYTEDKENSLLEFYLNYKKDINENGIDVMAGYSWQKFFKDNYNFAENIDGTETLTEPNSDAREYLMVSLFGRINYTYDSKFLATFTVRRDGTSRFSEDNRWGLFPAAALGYRLVDDASSPGLSKLKFRLGWGVTGQQEIGDGTSAYYAYLPQYQSSDAGAQYQFGNSFITTLRPNGYDANIRWEETTTYNAAVDFGINSDRLTGTIEVYQRKTKDLLNFVPVPAGTNLTNFITTNVGNLTNNGVELSLNALLMDRADLQWDFGFNIAYNENEITNLIATDDPEYQGVQTGGISGGVGSTIQIHTVGHPSSSFYVFEQVYDENGNPVEGLYVDRNGDGIINTDDRYRYEKPAANFSGGFTSRLAYKNFDFTFAGRASFGNYIYNNVWSGQDYNGTFSASILSNLNKAASTIDFFVPQYFTDYFVRDASFLRMDHITLGYNLDNLIGDFTRLTLTVQNPFVISDYEGLDPEVFNGIDNNVYPRPRTLVFGLNVNF